MRAATTTATATATKIKVPLGACHTRGGGEGGGPLSGGLSQGLSRGLSKALPRGLPEGPSIAGLNMGACGDDDGDGDRIKVLRALDPQVGKRIDKEP